MKVIGRLRLTSQFTLLITFAVLLIAGFIMETDVKGQNKKAVVILKPTTSPPDAMSCEQNTEIQYLTLYDLKINGKKDVRMAPSLATAKEQYPVSRNVYDQTRSSDLKNLTKIEWRGEILHAESGAGSPTVCLPSDLKLDKQTTRPLRELYSVTVEGAVREGKSKRKQTITLRSISKIYLLNETELSEEGLFRHASEENDVGQWKAYLRIPGNHRKDEASSALHKSLLNCAEGALDAFEKGKFKAIELARNAALEAQSVVNDESTRSFLEKVDDARSKVSDVITQVIALSQAEKWDECTEVMEPVRKYKGEHEQLSTAINMCLERSHALHLAAGKQALQGNRLEEALKEFEVALNRLPDSTEAKQGRYEAIVRITVRDSKGLRQRARSCEARELVAKKLSEPDYRNEPRLTDELAPASCECSNQIYTQARQLVTTAQGRPRPISNPTDKKSFKDAREKLVQATGMCVENGPAKELLQTVNGQLGGYHVTEARRALTRKASGTAYLHLSAAQMFTPENDEAARLLQEARDLFAQKARIGIGVVIRDRTNQRSYDIAQQLAGEAESALVRSRLANVTVLERDSAEQWLRQLMSGGRPREGEMNVVIFSGDLREAAVERRASDPRQVSVQYKIKNPDYESLKQSEKETEKQYNQCRKTNPEAACAYLRDQLNSIRVQLNRTEKCLRYDSYYTEQQILASGQMKLSLNVIDATSYQTRLVGDVSDGFRDQCTARWGVPERDDWCGFFDVYRNQECRLPDDQTYFERMNEKVKAETRSKVIGALREFLRSFFERAKGKPPDAALEDYITFVFLITNKTSPEFKEALEFIKSRDEDLRTDGILK
ncbi:MAG: hypothetical protein ABIN58_00365 [candidate division WOR-3 bacterium]